jgi:ubiquinone/menaquinone biosynthesis C-methylase UbiE
VVNEFVRAHGLQDKRILEIGSGIGDLQDIVADYTALDIAAEVGRFYHKPFVVGSATALPFKDNSFDAIWTFGTLQSVPNPEQALREMRRVLKPGGLLLLDSGWQCRSWAAQGYEVRPYSDFGFGGKLIKTSIPVRDSVVFRSLYVFPTRLLRFASAAVTGEPTAFRYTLLSPDYAHYWTPESEALNSMDPYEAILWFTSRGDDVLAFQGPFNPFFVRTGAIVFRVNKRIPRR